LVSERASSDQELLQVKIALDENDPKALTADLDHRLPAVRRFAAETLTRRAGAWDLEPARPAVIAGIAVNSAASQVALAFPGRLVPIDKKNRTAHCDGYTKRDDALVLCRERGDSAVIAAAARTAQSFPDTSVKTAVLSALKTLGPRAPSI